MEAPASHPWFLRKHDDGSIFGPLRLDQLVHWASSAQIAPHDYVSADEENWMKAPMLPELAMDWIVEVTSERLYGPTTPGAIREFLRLGEIDEQTFVINSCDATRQQIRDLLPLLESLSGEEAAPSTDEEASGPASVGISIAVQERIRELEQALREERRALAELEVRYRDLEARHRQPEDAAAASGQ